MSNQLGNEHDLSQSGQRPDKVYHEADAQQIVEMERFERSIDPGAGTPPPDPPAGELSVDDVAEFEAAPRQAAATEPATGHQAAMDVTNKGLPETNPPATESGSG